MPIIKSPSRTGGALLAGLFALSASTALAAPQAGVTVTANGVVRTVPVSIADLDLAKPHDRARLTTRVNVASRAACQIMRGSALNNSGDARRCLADSRADAWAQVERRSASGAVATGRSG